MPIALNSLFSDSQETPREIDCEEKKNSLVKKNYSKSSTFNYDLNGNLYIVNNKLKNENENVNIIENIFDNNEMKKSKTFNIDENINCNLQYNNGQNYLETVKETLNEVSNSRIDISGLNEEKNNNNNINNYENRIIKIENKCNEIDAKENNKIKNQDSDNIGSSCQATLSGGTNTKKILFTFK